MHGSSATQNPVGSDDPASLERPPQGLARRLALASGLSAAAALAGVAYVVSRNGEGLLLPLVGLVLLGGAVAATFTQRLATRLTRPLARLNVEVQRLADGQLEGVIALDSADEVAALARNFNRMATRMRGSIADLENSNRQLADANVELRELDRMKSDLIANASHELRTPADGDQRLHRVRRRPQARRRQRAAREGAGRGPAQHRPPRPLDQCAARLLAARGRLKLNRQRFALPLLVDHVHQTLRSMIERKSISFQTSFDVGLPDVMADRERLSQVFENLVINAIKFTPPGGRIEVAAKPVEQGDAAILEVSVSDTGVGIPPDQADRIFSRFHQVDATSSRRVGGVGLGLAIVKSIVDAHESTIRVESDPGELTRFTFTLPVAEGARADETRPPAPMAARAHSEHP